jgi:hypothetical protein
MLMCFEVDPAARPTFAEIGLWLETNAPADVRKGAEDFAAAPMLIPTATASDSETSEKTSNKKKPKNSKRQNGSEVKVDMNANEPVLAKANTNYSDMDDPAPRQAPVREVEDPNSVEMQSVQQGGSTNYTSLSPEVDTSSTRKENKKAKKLESSQSSTSESS